MKTKTFKSVVIAALLGLSLFMSAKMMKSDYKLLRTDFLIHAKGKTQHFINSLIN